MTQKHQPEIRTIVWFDKNRSLSIERRVMPRLKKRKVLYWLTLKNKITSSEYILPALTREDLQFIVDEVDRLERIIIEENL
ncbi:hypothetical protein FCL53_16970 [Elizabethkingia meningoseptica]|uniref:hypothetical protein n=1 Tax=Elizabethkingia meningoseptica TaxID=238 RepID=UPI0013651CA7|nr:hypothetical protein [Elizabethkingia meningoseptica]MVW93656.1 hypothetical protein [Elizabethkingia meningoseptica]